MITNGNIVGSDQIYQGNICIQGEKIAAILSREVPYSSKQTIDAEGNLIFPGAIDTHAHLNDPGFTWRENYEQGTLSSIIGGVTTVLDMPLQNTPALTNGEIFDAKQGVAGPKAYADHCFWGGLVDYNFSDLSELKAKGCIAVKSFIGPVSPDYVSLNMGQIREALEILKPLDMRAGFHCEDFSVIRWGEARAQRKDQVNWQDFLDSRPVVAELIATRNIIDLAKETGSKVHICHVSHPSVAEVIKQAQQDGVDITAETCSHYLRFSDQDVLQNGSLFKCAPPLREPEAVERLVEYVADGTLGSICSDHSPCAPEEKDEKTHGVFGAWGGISGIQSLLQVTYDELVNKKGYSPTLIAQRLGEGPAKTFGLYPQKGVIRVGSDADLVIFDPDQKWEITADSLHYVNKISAFVGQTGKGLPVTTLLRGKVMVENGSLVGEKGFGKLVKPLTENASPELSEPDNGSKEASR